MQFEGKATRNHDVIKKWVKTRNGWPALKRLVTGTREQRSLYIAFPEEEGVEQLERISWKRFFRKFEAEDLVFLYQDEKEEGAANRRFLFL